MGTGADGDKAKTKTMQFEFGKGCVSLDSQKISRFEVAETVPPTLV